jgi:hypothetical protein
MADLQEKDVEAFAGERGERKRSKNWALYRTCGVGTHARLLVILNPSLLGFQLVLKLEV